MAIADIRRHKVEALYGRKSSLGSKELTCSLTKGTLAPLERGCDVAKRTECVGAEGKPSASMADSLSICERAVQLGVPIERARRLETVVRGIVANEGLVAAQDAMFLAQTIMRLMEPKFATGRDLFARFGRDGPPSKLAIEPPREEPYVPYRLQR